MANDDATRAPHPHDQWDQDRYGPEMVGRQHLADQSANPDYEGGAAVRMSRNPSVDYARIFYRGHPVPYLEAFRVPVDGDGDQVFPVSTDEHGQTVVTPWGGPYRWTLVLDKRWAMDFDDEAEMLRHARFLADGMAVAAGWVCHGKSVRINRHGPAYPAKASRD